MTANAASNAVDMAMHNEPKIATPIYEVEEKHVLARSDTTNSHHVQPPVEFEADLEGEEPTAEELRTLKRVSGKIPWMAFTIAFVELCERFGYYGCQVLCMLSLIAVLLKSLMSLRHQLCPTEDPRHQRCRSDHRSQSRARWPTWRAWNGTACVLWYWPVQFVLGLHNAHHRYVSIPSS